MERETPTTVRTTASGVAVASVPTRLEELAAHPGMRALSLVLRLLLGVVFLISGAEKVGAISVFGRSIAAYGIVPVELSNILAIIFVWSELTVAVLLIVGVAIRGAALLTSVMLLTFLIAIFSALARGLDIDCGCGMASEPVGIKKVVEDVGLLAAAIMLLYFPRSPMMLENVLRDRRDLVE